MQHIFLEDCNLEVLVDLLTQGKTLVYPTETCYGLGCDPSNSLAVEKIFHIKKRPENKPMLLVFPNIEMLKKYIVWDTTLEKLSSYWPGPLTVVAQVLAGAPLAPALTQINHTVAVRVSSYPFVAELTALFGGPLVSTSANIAGEPNPYTATEIVDRFNKEKIFPDIIIDAGTLPPNPPSTLIQVDHGTVTVLRQGSIQVIHPI